MERKAYPAFEILIEINDQNCWTIHENIEISIDLLLRGNGLVGQVRQFWLNDKIKIKSTIFRSSSNSLLRKSNNFKNSLLISNKDWKLIDPRRKKKSIKFKNLTIYPYSLSNNLLKEVFLKMGLRFILTNDLQKADLILGLDKYLKQNIRLINLAKEKNIPVYTLNQISFYQVSKFIQFLGL